LLVGCSRGQLENHELALRCDVNGAHRKSSGSVCQSLGFVPWTWRKRGRNGVSSAGAVEDATCAHGVDLMSGFHTP